MTSQPGHDAGGDDGESGQESKAEQPASNQARLTPAERAAAVAARKQLSGIDPRLLDDVFTSFARLPIYTDVTRALQTSLTGSLAGMNKIWDPDGAIARRLGASIEPVVASMVEANPAWGQLTQLYSELLKGWAPKIFTLPRDWFSSFLPANLRGLGVEVAQLHMLALEGITVYQVPRSSIAARLLSAPDQADRRAILGRRLDDIARDCAAVLDTITDPDVRETVVFTRKAIAAILAGHPEAAQALLSAALEGLTWIRFGEHGRKKYTSQRETAVDDLDGWNLRELMVLGPVWSGAYQVYRAKDDGAMIPHTYARHASVHRVSRRQYNRRNTAQVLLLVTAFCAYINDTS